MIAAAVAGALVGAGLLLLIRALTGARAPLTTRLAAVDAATARSVAALGTGAWSQAGTGTQDESQSPARSAAQSAAQLWWQDTLVRVRDGLERHRLWRPLLDSRVRADLAILGIDPAAYAARKMLTTVVAVVATGAVSLSLGTAAGLPWISGSWLALVAGLATFVLPDSRVKAAAAARRRDFLATLTAYLDLVAMRTASGSGVSEALRDAAGIGNGYAWRRLQGALDDARLDGRTPAIGLARLGRQIGLGQLDDLASQLALVDSTGAQTEATLRAKAEALREEQLTDLHGDANARSQSMVLGQVALGGGFLVMIGYPALSLVLSL